jgi:hypothetical protein
LQITAGDETNKVEFHQNYALNHTTTELKRFNAIVLAIEEVLAHYEDLPESDCTYAWAVGSGLHISPDSSVATVIKLFIMQKAIFYSWQTAKSVFSAQAARNMEN